MMDEKVVQLEARILQLERDRLARGELVNLMPASVDMAQTRSASVPPNGDRLPAERESVGGGGQGLPWDQQVRRLQAEVDRLAQQQEAFNSRLSRFEERLAVQLAATEQTCNRLTDDAFATFQATAKQLESLHVRISALELSSGPAGPPVAAVPPTRDEASPKRALAATRGTLTQSRLPSHPTLKEAAAKQQTSGARLPKTIHIPRLMASRTAPPSASHRTRVVPATARGYSSRSLTAKRAPPAAPPKRPASALSARQKSAKGVGTSGAKVGVSVPSRAKPSVPSAAAKPTVLSPPRSWSPTVGGARAGEGGGGGVGWERGRAGGGAGIEHVIAQLREGRVAIRHMGGELGSPQGNTISFRGDLDVSVTRRDDE
ncbi:unnamed protein product [Vitrella brassicaformis CCMP3155]|uniref:Uncharacterized protein n=2 Tax=Vitrella brassicaformis TaxID=1169539 RepID=A0A0G4G8F6_VITBC|nr:unnamed protein product [Vitrella brassicaformis CCMP3155]|eukprot:CEM25115.1 unnamed protein product [Vitrella brassicaformis CCMP3155]